ncbi:MAG: sensor histidine kinase [Acidobacteriota bacterium]|nr:sensor histidine kinase [Acidobacteriota bacterium]
MTDTQARQDQPGHGQAGFRHEAFFYSGADDFVGGTVSFVEEGLRAGQPVMVALVPEKLELLRGALGDDAARVLFADMLELGRNPARIIPAWRRFVEEHGGHATLRGIGEPIWAARDEDELVECQRHEALLNMAFDGGRPWSLLCPYDAGALGAEVLHEARRSHPYLAERHGVSASAEYVASPAVFDGPLPEPALVDGELAFDGDTLRHARAVVSLWAAGVLGAPRAGDLVLAVHEVAANSVRHGGGSGTLRYWRAGASAVVEVRDAGRFEKPLAGREMAPPGDEKGRGLWLAQQLCDLVQLRSSPQGSAVRLHVDG